MIISAAVSRLVVDICCAARPCCRPRGRNSCCRDPDDGLDGELAEAAVEASWTHPRRELVDEITGVGGVDGPHRPGIIDQRLQVEDRADDELDRTDGR